MLRRLSELLFVLAVLGTAGTMVAARHWSEPGTGFWWRLAALAQMPDDTGAVDLTTLQHRAMPNDALVCPEAKCTKAKSDSPAPIFLVPVAELRRKLDLVVASEPRSAAIPCVTDCQRLGRYVEYSPLFYFPDVIDVEVIEAGAAASTLAIYSRSVFGYGDGGVNRQRVERWLAALHRTIPNS